MQLCHTAPVRSVRFDDPNLLAAAGVVPVMALAHRCGLDELVDQFVQLPTDKGAHAGAKVASLIAGMVMGADSIDDMAVLRHGAMGSVFDHPYAPSTLGSFLRAFTFGHVRQLDAVACRLLAGLCETTPAGGSGEEPTMLDLDDTVVQVHGYQKQGAGIGYNGTRGLNALLATVSATDAAPLIVAQRLRAGPAGSARGAGSLLTEALHTAAACDHRRILVRADSAFYSRKVIAAARRAGAHVSITARMNPDVKRAITQIDERDWTPIHYPRAVTDPDTGELISDAEVAEIAFTAFASDPASAQVPGRLIVRRTRALRPSATPVEQQSLFELWRFHAFFTTTPSEDADTVTADKIHRRHAIIEQVHADLKASALAHMPSGCFAANAAWLTCAVIAFNLTRAAASIAGPRLAAATTPTIRRTLIQVPARTARSARTLTLHLPADWPWHNEWQRLFAATHHRQPAAA